MPVVKKSTSEPRLSDRDHTLDALISTGQLMSNLCFNLKQRSSPYLLTKEDKQSMDDLQIAWDANLHAYRKLTRKSTSKPKAKR